MTCGKETVTGAKSHKVYVRGSGRANEKAETCGTYRPVDRLDDRRFIRIVVND
jgi:hypothetical protein